MERAADGYFGFVESYEDSQLWEMDAIECNLPDTDTVEMRIKGIVGGVMFDDYTLERWITQAKHTKGSEFSKGMNLKLVHVNLGMVKKGFVMIKFKLRVVSMAASAVLLVFIFGGEAGAGNEPCEDNFAVSIYNYPSGVLTMRTGEANLFDAQVTGDMGLLQGGSFNWYGSGNAYVEPHNFTPYQPYLQYCLYVAPPTPGVYELECYYTTRNECMASDTVTISVVNPSLRMIEMAGGRLKQSFA